MAFRGEVGLRLLKKIGNDNAKGEYYLTDLVELANRARGEGRGDRGRAAEEVLGINTRAELAHVEETFQARARARRRWRPASR